MGLAVGNPAFALGVKRPLLMGAKRGNFFGFISKELLIFRQLQGGVLDAQRVTSQREITPDGQ